MAKKESSITFRGDAARAFLLNGGTKPPQRWRFASDDDGHNYLIKEEDVQAFEDWLASYDEDYDKHNKSFDDCRINSEQNYSFTDPKEDRG